MGVDALKQFCREPWNFVKSDLAKFTGLTWDSNL
jgi:hypothetical protein